MAARPNNHQKDMRARRSGVALWRQIADQLRRSIGEGAFGQNDRLPSETSLAELYAVNRHTLRAAIAALVQEGVLRAEQGRGTFIERRGRLSYPIGARTRFSTGLGGQVQDTRGILLDHAHEAADVHSAEALGIAVGAPVIRLETLSEANGRPVSRSTSVFDAARFEGIERAYRKSGSMTAALRELNVADYARRSTLISARHASAADIADLRLSPGAIVLVTVYVNVDEAGAPIQFSQTRFAADCVELSVT
ncbi:phosphonate metabolism transcriptional regulator PhnF [Mesorhizobium sp. A623]